MSNLAVIHALRTAADGMKRLGEQQDRISSKIDGVREGVHDIDKRLAIIENNSVGPLIKDHEDRLAKLEERDHERKGAVSLLEWLNKGWASMLALIGLIVYALLNESERL